MSRSLTKINNFFSRRLGTEIFIENMHVERIQSFPETISDMFNTNVSEGPIICIGIILMFIVFLIGHVICKIIQ